MVRGSRKLPGLCERAGGRPWTLPGQAHATDIPGTFAVRSVCSVHLVQWGRNALVTQTKGLGRSWCAAQSTRSGPGRIPGSRRARRGHGTPSSVRRGARGENCGAQKNTDLDGDAVNVRNLLADVLRQQCDRKRPTLHPGHVPAQPSRRCGGRQGRVLERSTASAHVPPQGCVQHGVTGDDAFVVRERHAVHLRNERLERCVNAWHLSHARASVPKASAPL